MGSERIPVGGMQFDLVSARSNPPSCPAEFDGAWVQGRVRSNPRTESFPPGSVVRLTGRFLRNTGQYVGQEGQSTWTVVPCECGLCRGGGHIAVDQKDYTGGQRHIMIGNLEKARRRNPGPESPALRAELVKRGWSWEHPGWWRLPLHSGWYLSIETEDGDPPTPSSDVYVLLHHEDGWEPVDIARGGALDVLDKDKNEWIAVGQVMPNPPEKGRRQSNPPKAGGHQAEHRAAILREFREGTSYRRTPTEREWNQAFLRSQERALDQASRYGSEDERMAAAEIIGDVKHELYQVHRWPGTGGYGTDFVEDLSFYVDNPRARRGTLPNPGLMIVLGNPRAKVKAESLEAAKKAWSRFHQRDAFDGRIRELRAVKGGPDVVVGIGFLQGIDLGDGEQSFSGSRPLLVYATGDQSLWIVSNDLMDFGDASGRPFKSVTYDPWENSGKTPAYYRHKFHHPRPVARVVSRYAVMLDGGKYRVDDWLYE